MGGQTKHKLYTSQNLRRLASLFGQGFKSEIAPTNMTLKLQEVANFGMFVCKLFILFMFVYDNSLYCTQDFNHSLFNCQTKGQQSSKQYLY